MEILVNILLLSKSAILLAFVYFLVKLLLDKNVEYIKSVRSLVTILIAYTLCKLTIIDKIEAKDFLLICSTVMNFYFIVKVRKTSEESNNGEHK